MINKFLSRPTPLFGESLSGYLTRLAPENQATVSECINEVTLRAKGTTKNRKPLVVRGYGLDLYGQTSLRTLSELTDITIHDLKGMTCIRLSEKFGITTYDVRVISGLMSPIFVTTHRRICPLCTLTNGIHKLIWQISEIEICNVHKVRLQGQCWNCLTNQPYLSNNSVSPLCVNCGISLVDPLPEVVIDQQLITTQDFIYQEWEYLLFRANALVTSIYGMTPLQSLLAVLFYLSKDTGSNAHHLFDFTGLRRTIVDGVHETQLRTPMIKNVLRFIRCLGIPVWELRQVKVPSDFFHSWFPKSPSQESARVCESPWCTFYKHSNGLVWVPHMYKNTLQKQLREFRHHAVCSGCGIEYGTDEEDGVWKSIGGFLEQVLRVMSMLVDGQTDMSIARQLKKGYRAIVRIKGYIAFHGLLAEHYTAGYVPKVSRSIDRVLADFRRLALNGINLNDPTASKSFGCTTREYAYYLASPEVREFMRLSWTGPRARRDMGNKHIVQAMERVQAVLDELWKENINITKANVRTCTGLSWYILTQPYLSSIITHKRREQEQIRRENLESELIADATNYVFQARANGTAPKINDVWLAIGIRLHNVRKRFPTLFYAVRDLLASSAKGDRENNPISGDTVLAEFASQAAVTLETIHCDSDSADTLR